MNAMPYADNPVETEAVSRLRDLVRTSSPPARIDTVNDSLEWVMGAPLTGIYTAGGADVMAPERVMQARLAFCRGERWGSYYQVGNPGSPVVGMENVRCLLSRSPIPNPGLFDPAGTLPGRYIYRNRAELPRFYLVGRTRPARSMAEAAAMLRAPDFRPAEEAIVEGAERPAAGSGGGQVEVLQYGFQTVGVPGDFGDPLPGLARLDRRRPTATPLHERRVSRAERSGRAAQRADALRAGQRALGGGGQRRGLAGLDAALVEAA
jgi:hypothetical protein